MHDVLARGNGRVCLILLQIPGVHFVLVATDRDATGNILVPHASIVGGSSACMTRALGSDTGDPPVPSGLFPRTSMNRGRMGPRFRG